MAQKWSIIPGTTLILIATDAYNRYQSATGGVRNSATGLLSITSTQFSNLESLFFTAGGVRIFLPLYPQRFLSTLTSSVFSPTDYLWADPQCSNLAPFSQLRHRWYFRQHLPYRQWYRLELWCRSRLHQRYDLPRALLFRLRYRQQACWSCYHPVHRCHHQLSGVQVVRTRSIGWYQICYHYFNLIIPLLARGKGGSWDVENYTGSVNFKVLGLTLPQKSKP